VVVRERTNARHLEASGQLPPTVRYADQVAGHVVANRELPLHRARFGFHLGPIAFAERMSPRKACVDQQLRIGRSVIAVVRKCIESEIREHARLELDVAGWRCEAGLLVLPVGDHRDVRSVGVQEFLERETGLAEPLIVARRRPTDSWILPNRPCAS
jgi:hypothetical protein